MSPVGFPSMQKGLREVEEMALSTRVRRFEIEAKHDREWGMHWEGYLAS